MKEEKSQSTILSAVSDYLAELREERQRQGYYISDLGRCPCGVYWEMKGKFIPPSERSLRVMAVGTAIHEMIQKSLKNYYLKHKDFGKVVGEEESLEFPEWKARGRYDLLVMDKRMGKLILYDIKTIHSRGFWLRRKRETTAQKHHILQLQAYMYKLKKRFKNIEGRLWYVSRDDLSHYEETIAYDENAIDEIAKYFKYIDDCVKHNQPPLTTDIIFDEVRKCYRINWKSKWCPYHHLTKGENWFEEAKKEVRRLNKELGYDRKKKK